MYVYNPKSLLNVFTHIYLDILQPLVENPRPLLAKAKFYFSKIEETVTNDDNDADLKLSSSLIDLIQVNDSLQVLLRI